MKREFIKSAMLSITTHSVTSKRYSLYGVKQKSPPMISSPPLSPSRVDDVPISLPEFPKSRKLFCCFTGSVDFEPRLSIYFLFIFLFILCSLLI